jgi:hypothetical protein
VGEEGKEKKNPPPEIVSLPVEIYMNNR